MFDFTLTGIVQPISYFLIQNDKNHLTFTEVLQDSSTERFHVTWIQILTDAKTVSD